MNNATSYIIEAKKICKTFNDGDKKITLFKDINLQLNTKEKIAIIGSSGCGKSTLLHILAGLESPSDGKIIIEGKQSWQQLSDKNKAKLRNQKFGFVYQFHHLLADFSALENVCMPLFINNIAKKIAIPLAEKILYRIGLQHRIHHLPHQLSGGEKQRVAIARAIVNNPQCIFADEPTGNLDNKNSLAIINLLMELYDELSTSLIIVTHENTLLHHFDKVYQLNNNELTAIN